MVVDDRHPDKSWYEKIIIDSKRKEIIKVISYSKQNKNDYSFKLKVVVIFILFILLNGIFEYICNFVF